MEAKADYLIVGQGIAGSVLALTLEMIGKSVYVIDDSTLSSSSRIAAGVYNPFNFRRSIPTWRAADAIAAVHAFYPEAESRLNAKFHQRKDIVRIFGSKEEADAWKAYSEKGSQPFVRSFSNENRVNNIIAEAGYGLLEGGGMVDTSAFIKATTAYFSNRGYYIDERFEHALLAVNDSRVVYDDRVTAERIIFCEGHCSKANPFFNANCVAPTKGELLHLHIPGLNLSGIVNGPVYLAPLGNDRYVCGATFDTLQSDEKLTEKGKQELLGKLRTITQLPCTVVGHYAGVRPAGRDRKPVVGTGKKHKNIAIFNGMGSKGVMLSPLLAQLLVNHLEDGTELPAEIRVSRFRDAL